MRVTSIEFEATAEELKANRRIADAFIDALDSIARLSSRFACTCTEEEEEPKEESEAEE